MFLSSDHARPDAAFRLQDDLEDCFERSTGGRPYPALIGRQ
jgi:hypothetical protein